MKLAIIGAGGIAATMAHTAAQMDDVEAYAIGSRSQEKADAFAAEWGITKAYGSYEAMLDDPQIDLVYVATPHSHHKEWTIKALEAGKPVLCEKAFATSEQEARAMIETAERKGLLLAEAIWTRYMPSRRMITEIIERGTIGRLVTISANLGYKIDHNKRIMDPALAGGALLDLTVYPLNFASMVWGDDIRRIEASCVWTDTGVDGQDTVMLEYQDGRMASLFTTIYAHTNRIGQIVGTEGYIEVENINNPSEIRIYETGTHEPRLKERLAVPPQITGYEYELRACMKALEEKRIDCPEMPHAQTIQIMCQMDAVRKCFEKTMS